MFLKTSVTGLKKSATFDKISSNVSLLKKFEIESSMLLAASFMDPKISETDSVKLSQAETIFSQNN